MAADGVEFGKYCGFGFLTGFQCRIQTRTTGTDDYRVELMDHKHLPSRLLWMMNRIGRQLLIRADRFEIAVR
jgi:hypothetical protein